MHLKTEHKEIISAVNVVEGTLYVASYALLFPFLFIPFHLSFFVLNIPLLIMVDAKH